MYFRTSAASADSDALVGLRLFLAIFQTSAACFSAVYGFLRTFLGTGARRMCLDVGAVYADVLEVGVFAEFVKYLLDQAALRSFPEPLVHRLPRPIIAPVAFFDVEVFPNLFLVNYKLQGKGVPVVRLINPGPREIEEMLKYRLIGFNRRRYDNHILYARLMGQTVEELFGLSQRIVAGERTAFFGEAYDLS